ncbi:uncharacterized protein LOC132724948 isoform X1 [Ruditapes philippinarum]|uniref:uncharacterized protein LOC132724948 isoform X1 n=1 Tax=Ruditapes philippinarum TaxID=129788 RepID=UPI00295A8F3E|nr:uncharacterized protein LOC132724948 isoform X1 [Ruditapes philippinarum]XP_060565924.1 uncharacterized protein LOC132724948 isoform X1 [Ruditapes philippinarum]
MIWQRLAITTLLTICARLNLTTGGNISIQKLGNQTGEMSYECGRNVTLTCNFKKRRFAISWMNAIDVIPIVKCSQNNCFLTPDYEGQYRFTYDRQGIFNLTVIQITKEDNGRKLICSDGTDSDSEIIKVTDYQPLLFEDTISGTVRAISGCISQDTEVSFKWIKMSVSSGIEEEKTPTIHANYTRRCSNDSDCGYDQQVQYTEIISAKSSDNGNYFLKILAVYGNESKESYSTAYKYIFEDHDNERIDIAPVIGQVAVVVGVVGVVGVILGFILLVARYFVLKRRKQREKENVRQMNTKENTQNMLLKRRDTQPNHCLKNKAIYE